MFTATKVAGRYSRVTTVMTRMVAESFAAVLLRASVFSLMVCEII